VIGLAMAAQGATEVAGSFEGNDRARNSGVQELVEWVSQSSSDTSKQSGRGP
jgi:hypothetical protein